jgi:peptidoglycan-associated lipoprotein
MKAMLKVFVIVFAVGLLPSCSSGYKNPAEGQAAADLSVGQPLPGPDTGYYPGTGTDPGASAYPYAQGNVPGGRPLSGAMASADRVVYFDFDSAEIRADSRPVVEAQARYLAGNPSAATVLEGHADERGTREYNIALGERRANTVRQLMTAFGVSPQQIRTLSYGEERPAVDGGDEASYAQNRRVEIVY